MPASGFNEAAAYHCGKLQEKVSSDDDDSASMRPQHITAENIDEPPRDLQLGAASMRPQHITAENTKSKGHRFRPS